MEFTIPLPTTPHEVEAKIVAVCGHYGYDAVIDVKGEQLVIKYEENRDHVHHSTESHQVRPIC